MNSSEAGLQNPRIEITPDRALFDEEVGIRLAGFPPQTRITAKASMVDDLHRTWSSEAIFLTDAAGSVDVRTQSPGSGTYGAVDPMGLIWSLSLSPDETNLALFANMGLDPTTIMLTAGINGRAMATATLTQLHVSPGVVRTPVRDNGLRGTFFAPSGTGPHPAVILIAGSGGGLQEGHAALFASRGMAALALAYFAYEDLPKHLIDIPLEYFKTAIDWIAARPEVDREKIALLGKSRGGEAVLQLGSMFPEVKAVIAYVPSHVIWSGIGDAGRGEAFAWTYEGEGIPFMPSRLTQAQAAEIFSQPRIPLTPMFLINLEDAEAAERVAIPVERINGPVLLISAKDDQMWPSTMMGDAVMARLEAKGHAYFDKHYAYEDAGHMILTPYRPTTRNYSEHPVTGQVYAFDGTPEGYAAANKDSWAQVLAFLRNAFG